MLLGITIEIPSSFIGHHFLHLKRLMTGGFYPLFYFLAALPHIGNEYQFFSRSYCHNQSFYTAYMKNRLELLLRSPRQKSVLRQEQAFPFFHIHALCFLAESGETTDQINTMNMNSASDKLSIVTFVTHSGVVKNPFYWKPAFSPNSRTVL